MRCSWKYRSSMLTLVPFLIISLLPLCAYSEEKITPKDVIDKDQHSEETVLSSKDFENVPDKEIDLRKLGIDVPEDPTMGQKTEGDIAIPNLKRFMDDYGNLGRNAIRQTYRRWPGNEIPYTLSTQYGSYSRSVIAKAMNEYHAKTCVRFVARDARKHRDYVYIHPDDGCYSLVGRVGGRQPLSLDSGCIQTGTIVHELMHTVGFFHEQSRFDRDQYIDIIWPNVVNGADDQFEKYGMNVIDQLNEPYDYASIMHYGPFAFSSNGKRTIVARKTGSQKMGQRIQFSEIDLRKINRLYQCSSPGTTSRTVGSNNQATSPLASRPKVQTTATQETHFVIHPHPASISITGGNGKNVDSIGPIVNNPSTKSPLFPQNTLPTISPIESTDCKDKNWRCMFWSMSIFGYCEQFEEIRNQVCIFSCGTCTAQRAAENENTECQDRSSACSRINQESCSSPLTQLMCPRVCGLCAFGGFKSDGCVDLSEPEVCEHVRTLGLCAVRVDCARSCKLC